MPPLFSLPVTINDKFVMESSKYYPFGMNLYPEDIVPDNKGNHVYLLTVGYFKNMITDNGITCLEDIDTLYLKNVKSENNLINPFVNNSLNDPSNSILDLYFSLCDNSYSQDFLM